MSSAIADPARPTMEALHAHCLKCVNRRCMARREAGVCCDLLGCPLVCGAVFHACKLAEHRTLCPYERVPCLNAGSGCPFTLARLKMAEHLATCPASVVCCTMEWNRWPVSYADRKSYENLSRDFDFDEVEQLDMALALQDQRMLLESLRVTTTTTTTTTSGAAFAGKNGGEPVAAAATTADHGDGEAAMGAGEEESGAAAALGNGPTDMEAEPYGSPYSKASAETGRTLAAALEILAGSKGAEGVVVARHLNGDKNGAVCNGLVVNGDRHGQAHYEAGEPKNVDMEEEEEERDSDSECQLGAVGGAPTAGTNGHNELPWVEPDDFVELLAGDGDEVEVDVEEEKDESIDAHVEGAGAAGAAPPEQPLLLPLPPVVPPAAAAAAAFLLPDHVRNNLLQHLPMELGYRCLERKLQSAELLRGLSVFTFNGRRALLSDPHYLFRAKTADKAVDTSDLEVADDPMGLHGIDLITAALLFCLGDSPGGRGISDSRFVDGYHIDFGTQTFSFPSAILATDTMVGDIGSASACDHASPQLSNPSPFHTLRLDLVLESMARYQTKQRSMFTFVCGQLFRRDEFSSHFKNVHGDIHAGLNGWMEHRCPLAYYGCTYSQRRFCPAAQGSRVIHDRHLGAFGVRLAPPTAAARRSAARCDHFSRMPFEVLQHIAGFLDGFSLCQLSRASRAMRDVCASLLHTRGMVVLLWGRRRRADGSASWQITDKVWRFSTAFGTVTEWKFANIDSMADHLKKCPFNTVARRDDAIPLPCMCFTRELTREGRCLRSVLKPVA